MSRKIRRKVEPEDIETDRSLEAFADLDGRPVAPYYRCARCGQWAVSAARAPWGGRIGGSQITSPLSEEVRRFYNNSERAWSRGHGGTCPSPDPSWTVATILDNDLPDDPDEADPDDLDD